MSSRALAFLGLLFTASCSAATVSPEPRLGTAALALSARVDPTTRGGCALDASIDPSTLAYQTPSRLLVRVVSIVLLHDPGEVGGFSLGPSGGLAEYDLTRGATLGRALLSTIPEGTYSHVRVGLASVDLDVEAVAHLQGQAVPGTLEIDEAVATALNPARAQGDYHATFSAFGQSMSTSGNIPVASQGVPVPDAVVSTAGGKYELLIPAPGGAITIDHDTPRDIDLEIRFATQDAFAWQNVSGPGYTDQDFDLALSGPSDVVVGLCVQPSAEILGPEADAGSTPPGPDAGNAADAGTAADAGSAADSGNAADAGNAPPLPDAGTTDAGTTDAGATDAGATDAGTLVGPGDRRCVDVDLGFATGAVAQGIRPVTSAAQTGSCGGQGEEVVFLFSAPSAGVYAFDTAGSTYDTVLYARAAACDGSELGCNDDPPAGGQSAQLLLSLVQGQTIVLILDALNTWSQDPASPIGIYVLNIERP
ncbi:MAG: hypothetical protein U1E65_04800 [Myxococcota bacterium]